MAAGRDLAPKPPNGADSTGFFSDLLNAAVREGLRVPRYVPPVQEIDAAADGSVWLHLPELGGDPDALVVKPDEGIVMRVRVPRGEEIEDVQGRFLWTSGTGDFDAPTITLFRLRARE